ncbi:MAG: hypothetical protein D6816_16715 [Bacteroidetes bacterium]|nr:MAG: hypothetical protein D6816_16715 [Bacteroidota bacterium]
MNELTDTQQEADAVMLALLQQTPVWRKLQLMEQLNEMTHALAFNVLRQCHPDTGDAELRRLWAERLFGRELSRKLSDHLPGRN